MLKPSKYLAVILLLLFALSGSGCATIIQPGPDRVEVTSEPSGALVKLDGEIVGRTPMTVHVNRASDGRFEISKEGYQSVQINRDKVVAGWVFADIIFPIVSLTVDLVCHNQGKYTEEPIHVILPHA
jgi:hypothetical protein